MLVDLRHRDHSSVLHVDSGRILAGPFAVTGDFTINRLVADDGAGVSDVTVIDGVRVDLAISFFELRDGRIWRLTEYWREDGDAPEWRSRWAEVCPAT